jgi:hypothetical protein
MDKTFTVGPNPFQDELTVHVETNDTTTIEVAIHDLTGKIIASQKTSNDKKIFV